MIESRGAARRAASASALGAVLCAGLCSLGGTSAAGGAPASGDAVVAPALEWSVSSDGRYLAVSASRGRKDQYDGWVVSIEDGAVRELGEVERAAPQLAFDERGWLRIYTIDAERGTPALLWADPSSGAVLEQTRDRARIRSELEPLERGWARVDRRRSADRELARRVEWPDQRIQFELDSKRDVELAISDEPGVVFYARRVGDQLRLVRRELLTGAESTLVTEGRGLSAWSVSSDGRAVALHERGLESRVRVIDAASGALLAGPWLGDGVEWATGGGARRLIVSSGDRRRLMDILLDKEQPAGDWRNFAVLADGSVVAEVERELVLLDAQLSEVRVLFQGPQIAPRAAQAR